MALNCPDAETLPSDTPESPPAAACKTRQQRTKEPESKELEAKGTEENEAKRFMSSHMKSVSAKELVENRVVEVTFLKQSLGLVLRRPKDSVVVLGKPVIVKEIQPLSEAHKLLMETYVPGRADCETPTKSSLKPTEWLLCEINGTNVAELSYQRVLGLIVRGRRPLTAKFKPLLKNKTKAAPLVCPICCQCACNSKTKSKQQAQFCKGLCNLLLGDTEHSASPTLEELEWNAPLRGHDEFDINIEHIPTTNDKAVSQWWGDLYSRLQLPAAVGHDIAQTKTSTWCSMNKIGFDAFCLSLRSSKMDKNGEVSSTRTSTFQLAGANVYCYATSSTPWSMSNVSPFTHTLTQPTSTSCTRHPRHSSFIPTSNAGDLPIKHIRKAASDGACAFQLLSLEDVVRSRAVSSASTSESSGIELLDKVEVTISRSASARSSDTSGPVSGRSSLISTSSVRSTSSLRSTSSVRSTTSTYRSTSFDDPEDDDNNIFEQTRSLHSRRKEEQISNMPSKAHRLLIGDDANGNASKRKSSSKSNKLMHTSRRTRKWSIVKQQHKSRKARVLSNIAKMIAKKSATPILKKIEGHSSTFFENVDDAVAADVLSEPCMSGGSMPGFSHTTDVDGFRETYPISGGNIKGGFKETTVAVLLPKCVSLNRPHDKVLFIRVRTKKEASNLTTVMKRNICAANAQVFLKACRNNDSKQLSEVFDNLMSKDDIQSIRAEGCCELIGKRGIEDTIKHNNLSSLKQLLEVLVRA